MVWCGGVSCVLVLVACSLGAGKQGPFWRTNTRRQDFSQGWSRKTNPHSHNQKRTPAQDPRLKLLPARTGECGDYYYYSHLPFLDQSSACFIYPRNSSSFQTLRAREVTKPKGARSNRNEQFAHHEPLPGLALRCCFLLRFFVAVRRGPPRGVERRPSPPQQLRGGSGGRTEPSFGLRAHVPISGGRRERASTVFRRSLPVRRGADAAAVRPGTLLPEILLCASHYSATFPESLHLFEAPARPAAIPRLHLLLCFLATQPRQQRFSEATRGGFTPVPRPQHFCALQARKQSQTPTQCSVRFVIIDSDQRI